MSNALRRKIVKRGDRAEAARILNHPFPAVEESLVNAVYHRGYDQREPVEVRINPDGIESQQPGPDASIRLEALAGERIVARRCRNRRIGEFLKELDLIEDRSSGIPKIRSAMATNGSPPPLFSTDEGRTYFLVELPVHPGLAGEKAHDEAHDEAHQELTEAEAKILSFVSDRPRSRPEIARHLGQKGRSGNLYKIIRHLGLGLPRDGHLPPGPLTDVAKGFQAPPCLTATTDWRPTERTDPDDSAATDSTLP